MESNITPSFLQSFIDYLPVLIYAKSLRPENYGQMIVWNKAAEVITGYRSKHVIGNADSGSFPAGLTAQFDTLEQQMMTDPMVIDIPEIPFQRQDGGLRFLHLISVPLFDEENRIEYILGIGEDITERRRQELTLRTQQAELVAANDASPLGLFRTGPDGSCTYVNRTYEEMSGLTREQALGDGWIQSIHPEDRLQIFQAWGQASRNNQPYQGIYRFRHTNQRIVWVSVKTAPILVDGQGEGYVGSVDDITTKLEAERALRSSEARLRTITDTLPAMIAYVDANQRYHFNNLAYARTFGMSRELMRNKSIQEIWGEAMYLRFLPYIQRVLEGETLRFEIDEKNEGIYCCAEITYIPQFSDDGRQVVGFHVMNQDITTKKLEEQRLVQLAQIDSLTNIVNRAGFNQRLSDAMAYSETHDALIAVMYLDIDHFKQINDSYGHQVGDMLLKAFVQRLSRTLRSTDTVARLGGDEFTVIMEKLNRHEDAATVAAKIVQVMQAPFPTEEITLHITVSIGLAFYQGGPTDRDELIRQADEMLYQAKEAGRNTYRIAPKC
jgi:diguanylate cyclase (GGDEF)-like protein/PAS domain S-box-containing protein